MAHVERKEFVCRRRNVVHVCMLIPYLPMLVERIHGGLVCEGVLAEERFNLLLVLSHSRHQSCGIWEWSVDRRDRWALGGECHRRNCTCPNREDIPAPPSHYVGSPKSPFLN